MRIEGKPIAKKESVEILDFIIKILIEYEKRLSLIITELGETVKRFGEARELTGRIQWIEKCLSAMQKEISAFVRSLPSPLEIPFRSYGSPVVARCKQWKDFKVLAANAKIISFTSEEAEKVFQANALKDDLTLTYSGDFPKGFSQDKRSLKTWLSKELNIAEEKIFVGTLATKYYSYGSRMDIIECLLERAIGGSEKVHVMYQCNLSKSRFQAYFDLLLSGGFIKENGQSIETTERGLVFIGDYRELKRVIESETFNS